jgi:filamin
VKNRFQNLPFKFNLQRYNEVVLTTAGQERAFEVMCLPGPLDPASCVVEQPNLVATPWIAGEMLEVRVNCRDRFGNPVKPPSPEDQATGLVIVADGEGPGMVEADVVGLCTLNQVDP